MTDVFVIRADASAQIGAGHVMRSTALARAIAREGARAMVVTRTVDDRILAEASGAGVDVVRLGADPSDDAATTATLAGADATVVLDGYHFDATYIDALHARGCRVVSIEDRARDGIERTDVLLDQNIGALRQPYTAASARLLLGPRFMLLRDGLGHREPRRRTPPFHVLVTLGASDVGGAMRLVLEALAGMTNVTVTAVLGALNPRADDIERDFGSAPRIQLLRHTPTLAPLMADADVAIAAVGITLWELAACGVPTLMISATDIHRELAAVADAYGAHRWLGHASELQPAQVRLAVEQLIANESARTEMSRLGGALIDGNGARRAAAALRAPDRDWMVRRAGSADAEPIWEIASDATVRAMAFDSSVFPFAQHESWFHRRMASGESSFWVAERDGTVGGFVRYDRAPDDRAEIDVAVAPAARHRGLATRLLRDTSSAACQDLSVSRVTGVVLDHNVASQRAFAAAGYTVETQGLVRGRLCTTFARGVGARV